MLFAYLFLFLIYLLNNNAYCTQKQTKLEIKYSKFLHNFADFKIMAMLNFGENFEEKFIQFEIPEISQNCMECQFEIQGLIDEENLAPKSAKFDILLLTSPESLFHRCKKIKNYFSN